MSAIAKVAIVSPLPQLNRLFDYSIPEEMANSVQFGVRVRVSFGRATELLEGFVVELSSTSEYSGKLSPISEVVTTTPVLTKEVLELCFEVAERSAANMGELLKLAVPAHMPKTYEAFLASSKPTPHFPNAETSDGFISLDKGDKLAILTEPRVRGSIDSSPALPIWTLQFASMAKQVISRGESVLLLIPDYREQAMVTSALIHAGLNDFLIDYSQDQPKSKRYGNFLRLLGEHPFVVVGTRSVALAPAHNLGAILVWDEADPSYTDQGAPYLNARELVLVRQQQSQCALVFASHSRSTDIQRLVEIGYLRDLNLPFAHPKVAISDHGFRVDSLAHSAIKKGLAHGPVLVQVASKGQSSALYCSRCDVAASCSFCGGPLWKDSEGRLRCRWCNSFKLSYACSCGETMLTPGRAGSTRTATELGKAFPNARVIEATGETKTATLKNEKALVVATAGAEPYIAGGYAAVVILDAQVLLSRQFLRSQESAIRQWSNAIAKLGPEGRAVVVGISGNLGQAIALWQHRELASEELKNRRELGLPPALRLGSVHGELKILNQVRLELSKSEDLVLLGPAPAVESGEESWRLMFKYPYGKSVAVAQLVGAVVAKISAGQISLSKSGRGKRSLQIRMNDAEVI